MGTDRAKVRKREGTRRLPGEDREGGGEREAAGGVKGGVLSRAAG